MLSKKLNTSDENKINWKEVTYPFYLNEIENKIDRDKKKQNFRIKCEKYCLNNENELFLKKLDKSNNINKYKIPFEIEKIGLFHKHHDKKNHISYKRMIIAIKEDNYYWKSIRNDCKNYCLNCPYCIKMNSGKIIKSKPKKILTYGPRERYIMDGWKIHNELMLVSGFTWVIDIIDHFSKYLMSFPISNNNAQYFLNYLKEFCILKGIPKILQTDNGSEYKNNLFNTFCENNNIQHIFSSPYHPQTNGVIEVAHKEILKNVIIEYSKYPDNFDFKSALLDAVSNHNNNIHTTTKYKPCELFENSNE